MIRILIAEDQGMVRGALAALLALEPDLEVVAQVSSGDQVLSAARETHPDVALLDIEMPGMDGIEAAAALRRELPETAPLIVTTFGRPAYLRRAMEVGASGFLVKDAPAERLANAIRRTAGGGGDGEPPAAPPPPCRTPTARSLPANGRCSRRAPTGPRWPRSRGACTSRRAPSATTCPRR